MKGFIAVDGGGSKTELVLVDILGNIFARKIVNCSNPNDVGMEHSFSILSSSIKELMKISKTHNLELAHILLAIAGIEFGDSRKILKDKLRESLSFENISVEGDLASVKEVALGNKSDGVVVISGTGFNMAVKKNNEFSHVGGWGYLPDDYFCGFDLGKDALIASSRAINKVGDDTILVSLLEEHYGNALWYSMAQIYNEGIKGVASLSRLVIEAYNKEDKVAKNIINGRLKNLAKVIMDKTSEINDVEVYLFGGIFENNEFIVKLLNEYLTEKFKLKITSKRTIYGAVSLGIKNVLSEVNSSFYSNFDKNYTSRRKWRCIYIHIIYR